MKLYDKKLMEMADRMMVSMVGSEAMPEVSLMISLAITAFFILGGEWLLRLIFGTVEDFVMRNALEDDIWEKIFCLKPMSLYFLIVLEGC